MDIAKHFGSSQLSTGKANKPKKEPNYKKIPWHQCQCSGSSQIPIQGDLNYYQFLSLYNLEIGLGSARLIIYNTEIQKKEEKDLGAYINLDDTTCITQLPNGKLFCYGSSFSGTTAIIDRNYRVKILPSGTYFYRPTALYFDNNIYCFGQDTECDRPKFTQLRKFDLIKNRWIDLDLIPEGGVCDGHSVIFNGNILISGYFCKNLWLYSIEIDSFSLIPYDFAKYKWKLLINVERLYLIEWHEEGLIYESEDEYHWKPISKSEHLSPCGQVYCLYNKEKIHISFGNLYYQFDLKTKVVLKIA